MVVVVLIVEFVVKDLFSIVVTTRLHYISYASQENKQIKMHKWGYVPIKCTLAEEK